MTRTRRTSLSHARPRGHRLTIEVLEERQLLTAVTGRHIFYNNSGFDNNTPAASVLDASAIATDKAAYVAGGAPVGPANVTSYSKGINGIMVDLIGPHGTITAADFTLRMSEQLVGVNNSPGTWVAAPAPSVTVLSDTPVAGMDRIELIWPDGTIVDRYLQVIVEGNDATGGNNTNTGLDSSDTFYFGNKVGDDFLGYPGFFNTDATDEIDARVNSGTAFSVGNAFDFNRDYFVDASDQIIARNNAGFMPALDVFSVESVYIVHDDGSQTFYPPAEDTDEARGTAFRNAATAAVSGDTVWLGPGTFNIDATTAAIYLAEGVSIKGAGIDVTTIESGLTGNQVAKSILVLGNNAVLEDFTFHGTAVNNYQRPIGSEHVSVENAILRRIKIYAPNASDCLYDWGTSTSSYFLYDCDFRSGLSCIKMLTSGGGDTLYAENCYFEVLAENYSGPEYYLAIVAFNKRATQTFKDCHFFARGEATGRTAGALVWGEFDGTTILENCEFDVISPSVAAYDLDSAFYRTATGTPEFIVSGGHGSGPSGEYIASIPSDVTYLDAASDEVDASALVSALAIPAATEPDVTLFSSAAGRLPVESPDQVSAEGRQRLHDVARPRATSLATAVDVAVDEFSFDDDLIEAFLPGFNWP